MCGAAIVSLVFYSLVLPALAVYALYRGRFDLDDPTAMVYVVFQPIYSRYERRLFFWEVVATARKVCLVCVTMFFTKRVRVSAPPATSAARVQS